MKQTRMKNTFLVALLVVLCSALIGCTKESEEPPQAVEDAWASSSYSDSSFAPSYALMEMAFEAYGTNDTSVSYTITNTKMDSIVFDGDFSLEFNRDGTWVTVPFVAELEKGEPDTLPGLQMCLVEVDMALFGPDLPIGKYRIVRTIGEDLLKAEFMISETRIAVKDMSFGFEPLTSLSPDYDATDAENDGCYVLMEDGPMNLDVIQRFADKIYLGVPAKLRTAMLAEDGGTLIRDIIFEPLSDGYGRYSVITDASRTTVNIDTAEDTYSFFSVAEVGNKKKVCLSNYASYSLYAPVGAPLELISPDSPDNIDLIATTELRIEESQEASLNKFLVFGPNELSYATISRSGNTFGYLINGEEKIDIPAGDSGSKLDDIQWMSDKQLLLTGTNAGGESFQITYEIEDEQIEQ